MTRRNHYTDKPSRRPSGETGVSGKTRQFRSNRGQMPIRKKFETPEPIAPIPEIVTGFAGHLKARLATLLPKPEVKEESVAPGTASKGPFKKNAQPEKRNDKRSTNRDTRNAIKAVQAADARSGANVAEPLAALPYSQELQFKNEAFRLFWKECELPDKPNTILPSPKPRGYRTTSKRRVTVQGGEIHFDFKPEARTDGAARLGNESALEPEAHAKLFGFIQGKLNSEAYTALARSLNFVVIRGDYTRFAVIFNVFRTNADVVRKAKMLASQLERDKELGVIAAWLFIGPGDSPFYLDMRAPKGPWKAKRLFGPENFAIQVADQKFDFHPLGFTQVNLSLLPQLVEGTVDALKLRKEDRFIDLYCGYGLFSLSAAAHAGEVIGMDAAETAIPSARSMAASRRLHHVRFFRETIDARSLEKFLPKMGDKPEVVLLDPPKAGAGPGVIRTISARQPKRVVQLFCGMDALKRDCDAWRRSGYMIVKAVPYDMFPGTDELELMVVFVQDKFGLLNRAKPKSHIQPHSPEAAIKPARPPSPSRSSRPSGSSSSTRSPRRDSKTSPRRRTDRRG